jgi:hypothetical protein
MTNSLVLIANTTASQNHKVKNTSNNSRKGAEGRGEERGGGGQERQGERNHLSTNNKSHAFNNESVNNEYSKKFIIIH